MTARTSSLTIRITPDLETWLKAEALRRLISVNALVGGLIERERVRCETEPPAPP